MIVSCIISRTISLSEARLLIRTLGEISHTRNYEDWWEYVSAARQVKKVGQVEISCGDYWDFPRVFLTRWHGRVMMFYCPFDDDRDDYGDHFAVYELPSALAEHIYDRPWPSLKSILESEGMLVGRISVKEVKFPGKDERRWSGGEPPKPGTKAILICWMDDEVFEKLGFDKV